MATANASFPTHQSQKASNFDDLFMQHSLHFANSFKDLRTLREQLYSAAEHFESSFDKEEHKQFLVETSKDYVGKALVNTVDHLGSVADKLNTFLDEKASQFWDTSTRFSCIQQKLNTIQGFMEFRGIPRQWTMEQPPKHHNKYIIQGEENFQFGKKSELLYKNCISCFQYDDMHQIKQDNTLFARAFQVATAKQHPKSHLRGKSKIVSSANSPQLTDFSFTWVVPKKEPVKRSVSPLRFPIMMSGPVAHRSPSPSPSATKEWDPISEPRRRAISVSRRAETMNVNSYAKKSKHMFKAILTTNRPRRDL